MESKTEINFFRELHEHYSYESGIDE